MPGVTRGHDEASAQPGDLRGRRDLDHRRRQADAARDAEAAGAEGVLVSGGAENLAAVRATSSNPGRLRPGGRPPAADACIVDNGGKEQILAEHWEVARGSARKNTSSSSSKSSIPKCSFCTPTATSCSPTRWSFQDVPAGKLAIADVGASTRDQVAELERAGMDAVIVYAGNIADLVGSAPPEV